MKLYKLDKTVLLIKNDAVKFLNGLTSNDMDKPDNAFLNIHGKIVATFDQKALNDQEVVLLIEKPFKEKTLEHIDKYAKLGGVIVDELTRNVYFDLDGAYQPQEKEWSIAQPAGQLIVTENALEGNVSAEEFQLFRLNNSIPVHGIDYHDEMLLNVSMKRYVSFTKGCYLGQEPISKVYNRSKPTWRLVVKNEKDLGEEKKNKMTSKTTDPETKELKGFVFERNDE